MDAPTPIETSQAASDAKRARETIAWTEISAPGRVLLTNEFGLIALIAIFGAIFALGTPGFGSQFNLFTLGRTTAIDIMIGFSMMVVIVTGGLNLSVGAIGVCAAMAMGWLLERVGLPLPLSIVGALALGGALGAVAILLKSEFLVVFVGGVFVAETTSVLLQRLVFKYRRKRHGLAYAQQHRVFLRAPLHHHFELKGWPETQVVVRFWILGILCAFVALSTLKLR